MLLHEKVRREKISGKKEDVIRLQQPLVQVK
jgi:hypothetical protein